MYAHIKIIQYIFIGVTIISLSFFLYKLLLWARKGNKAAILIGALFLGSGIAPDPIFERSLHTIREAKEEKAEQDESGDPPTIENIG